VIIVDRLLARRAEQGKPIRTVLIGAGAMSQGVALQLERFVAGIELVGVGARRPQQATDMLGAITERKASVADSRQAMNAVHGRGDIVVSEDAISLCRADFVDVVVEVTGSIHHALDVTLATIDAGKHIILMNAELDSTLGPLLKRRADSAGVVLSNVDGDQPGVLGNLYRYVAGLGVDPRLCGNIKGLQDPYRTPTTQKAFAERWRQSPAMVTSFADGTKISFEQAIVANAFGMKVAKRGMHGPTVSTDVHVNDILDHYPDGFLDDGGRYVDYVVGAAPAPGVFVIGRHDHPLQQHFFDLYKLGKGPYYCFYTPYHLCHFEVHNTIARAALFHDATLAADAGLCVDVVATAKTDLKAGDTLDGIGCYMSYGQCENASTAEAEGLLPVGVAEGCTLLRDIPKDTTLTYADVTLPPDRLADTLREEQKQFIV
jgi:predicted homoserine dehydrogenase-like protein